MRRFKRTAVRALILLIVLAALALGAQGRPAARAATTPIAPPVHNFTEYIIPTPNSTPYAIIIGANKNLWFTERTGNKIGQFILGTSTITETALPANSDPTGLAQGTTGGNIRFTMYGSSRIGRITASGPLTATGSLGASYPTASKNSGPLDITVGKDGLWFTQVLSDRIGYISPGISSPVITDAVTLAPGSQPHHIAAGPDGSLWFTERGTNKIGMTPPITRTHAITFELTLPTAGSEPYDIAVAPDGTVWFTEFAGNAIGRFDPIIEVAGGNPITEFPLPSPDSGPAGITIAPDGTVWFTEAKGNRIGRLTPALGAIAEFPLPNPDSGPEDLVVRPDGTVWFTESKGNRIGMLELRMRLMLPIILS